MLIRFSTIITCAALLALVGYNLCILHIPAHKGAYYVATPSDVRVYPENTSVPGHFVPIQEGLRGPEVGRVEVYVSFVHEDESAREHATCNLWLGAIALVAVATNVLARRITKKRPNQALLPTTMSVTPAAGQPPRQP
jgi:hypothetical protein